MAWLWASVAAVVGVAVVLHALRAPGPSGGVSLCLLLTDQAERAEGLVGEALSLADLLSPWIRDLVLVDAGSTDGTADILRRICRDRPALKVLLLPDADGAGSALERAEALCVGPWMLSRRFAPRSLPARG